MPRENVKSQERGEALTPFKQLVRDYTAGRIGSEEFMTRLEEMKKTEPKPDSQATPA